MTMIKALTGVALLTMAEDMEVMRQLLAEAMSGLYQQQVQAAASPYARYGAASPVPPQATPSYGAVPSQADPFYTAPLPSYSFVRTPPNPLSIDPVGSYVPGYGVIYQATAPMPLPDGAFPPPRFDDSEGISPWDAARQRLRGEQPKQQTKQTEHDLPVGVHEPTRSQLTNRVLNLLAENGQHFRELADHERVTVALVFRDRQAARCAACHDTGHAKAGAAGQPGEAFSPSELLQSVQQPLTFGGRKDAQLTIDFHNQPAGQAEENEGDLHMRQRNFEKAVDAYAKALRAAGVKIEGLNIETFGADTRQRALIEKLAQAAIGQGQYDKAKAYLDHIAGAETEHPDEESSVNFFINVTSAGTSAAARLPASLVISATKSQLDAVASGQIDRDEFAKQAQVEFFDPLQPAEPAGSDDKTTKPK